MKNIASIRYNSPWKLGRHQTDNGMNKKLIADVILAFCKPCKLDHHHGIDL